MRIIFKIDRLAAWVLFIGMFLYFITGYGMTKGIISTEFSTKMHLSYLTYIILIAFTIHTSFAIHLAFKRWRIWNATGKVALVTFFLAFFSFFIYLDKFYQKEFENKIEPINVNTSSVSINSSINNNANSVKTFTIDELAKYNGKNGNPAYVAVDGDVYNLTNVFKSGNHFSHLAGTELTNAFYSYHAKKALSKYPVIGTLL